jgi:hypothetical protein
VKRGVTLAFAMLAMAFIGCSVLLDFDKLREIRDGGIPDLAGADLTGVIEDLAGADLTGVVQDFAGADLTGVDLAGALTCLPVSAGGPYFDPHAEAATPSYPRSLAVADMDKDGKLDLVIGTDSNNVYVLKNQGNRTFAAGVGYASGCTAGYHRVLLAADFDGDGNKDIVSGCDDWYGGNAVSELAFLKGDGTGVFAAPVQLTNRPVNAFSGAVADIDGDGTSDAIVVAKDDTLGVYFGATSGFAAQTPFKLSTHFDPWGVVVQPLGGDGIPDVVVANAGGDVGDMAVAAGTLQVFRRDRTAGNQRKLVAPTGADDITLAGALEPLAIGAGKLDGDARPELVLPAVGTTVYIAKGGGGGAQTTYSTVAAGPAAFKSPRAIAVGDLDCDGIDDAVLTHFTLIADPDYDRYEIYKGGNGSMTQVKAHDVSVTGSPMTDRVHIADLDGDGYRDVVMTLLVNPNGKYRILWGRAAAP